MMEARLILATMAQRWHVSLEPHQEVLPIQLVTVRPKNGASEATGTESEV